MALFIAQTDGTTNFDVSQAQLDLIDISNIDMSIGFDETNTVSRDGVTLVPVSYARTETGVCAVRLDDLVNELTYTAPPDIIVFAVDDTFTLSDGTPVKGNGFALPLGNSANPFSNDVCTMYDKTLCGGDGIWVDKEGGGKTYMTTSVMLYHELSHCFHFVTGTTASSSAEEEKNAEIDENEMRDQKGIDHRDVDSHNGGCGAVVSGCCVIASLSSGSVYSDEVNRLRKIRSEIFGYSEIGNEFFKQLHYNYYSFSPEVCRLMANNEDLQIVIKDYFVIPLIMGLEMIIYYKESKAERADYTAFLAKQHKYISDIMNVEIESYIKRLECIYGLLHNKPAKTDFTLLNEFQRINDIQKLFDHINIEILNDEYIKWALLEVTDLWVCSSASILNINETDPESARDLNDGIYRRISAWISQMPIGSIWGEYSRIKTEIELDKLSEYIFDKESRNVFAARLATKYPVNSETIKNWCN